MPFDCPFFSIGRIYRSISLLLLLGSASSIALGQSPSVGGSCPEQPLAFRADIRPLDPWEVSWEEQWPNVMQAMNMWRASNFAKLQGVWSKHVHTFTELQAEANRLGLPPSAVHLAAWSMTSTPYVSTWPLDLKKAWRWATPGMTASEAMTRAHQWSGSQISLDEWAVAVRTGMRLMENLDMPQVHVVAPGETVYSIARLYNVPPSCLGDKNDVWDNLQPGTPLLIPNLSSPR